VEKAYGSEVQDFLKTHSGKRLVDLHSTVGKLLREFIGERAGLVFASKKSKPLSQTNLLKRYLHPLMKQLKLTQAGFHSFRRFRATWLDMQSVPDDLTKFWLGHAAKDVTGRYVKYAKQIQYRKEVASTVGVGFDVPAQLSSLVGQSGQKETASSGALEAVEVTESV
jgi:integrase